MATRSHARRIFVAVLPSTLSTFVVFALGACSLDYLDADAGALGAKTGTSGDGSISADGQGPLGDGGVSSDETGTNEGGTTTPDGGCDYACVVMKDKPLVYLQLNEPVGAGQAVDSSGNNFHGTYPQAGVTAGVPGIMPGNTGVKFVGSGPQAIKMPACANFNGPSVEFSVELWLKADVLSGLRFLLDHQTFAAQRAGWFVGLSDDETHLEMFENNTTFAVVPSPVNTIKVGQWHHIVFTYSNVSHLAYLFVDTKVVVSNEVGSGQLPTLTSWSIGKQNCTPCEGLSFAGTLDEIAIYEKTLSENTVKEHYKASGR
jgi:large repetitive protein